MQMVKEGKDLYVFPENAKQASWIEKQFNKDHKVRTLKARFIERDGKAAIQMRLVEPKSKDE